MGGSLIVTHEHFQTSEPDQGVSEPSFFMMLVQGGGSLIVSEV